MPSKKTEIPHLPGAGEDDVERLSRQLKAQVRRAKERISDHYKLIEERSFRPAKRQDR